MNLNLFHIEAHDYLVNGKDRTKKLSSFHRWGEYAHESGRLKSVISDIFWVPTSIDWWRRADILGRHDSQSGSLPSRGARRIDEGAQHLLQNESIYAVEMNIFF